MRNTGALGDYMEGCNHGHDTKVKGKQVEADYDIGFPLPRLGQACMRRHLDMGFENVD